MRMRVGGAKRSGWYEGKIDRGLLRSISMPSARSSRPVGPESSGWLSGQGSRQEAQRSLHLLPSTPSRSAFQKSHSKRLTSQVITLAGRGRGEPTETKRRSSSQPQRPSFSPSLHGSHHPREEHCPHTSHARSTDQHQNSRTRNVASLPKLSLRSSLSR